jgi:hypothetical protein
MMRRAPTCPRMVMIVEKPACENGRHAHLTVNHVVQSRIIKSLPKRENDFPRLLSENQHHLRQP